MPVRIQRKRTKGWKMPEGAVYVGRGTKWGNPFRVGADFPTFAKQKIVAQDAVELYVSHLYVRRPDLIKAAKTELRGKDLACWCKPGEPCHADVLLVIANEEES